MGNIMADKALSESKKALILEHRTTALKIARSLLRRWNLFIDINEVQSLSDIALCEAVRGFDESRGTRFSTYLFPYIKGILIAELKSVKRDQLHQAPTATISQGFEDSYLETEAYLHSSSESVTDESETPEHHTYRRELREICAKALGTLLPLERQTLVGVHVMDEKVAQLARKIGYSRPYLSSIRTRAIEKMQPYFEAIAA